MEKVSLQLKWLHQAQFAGYYVAADAGFYAEEGLAVDIRVGGPGCDPEAIVAAGEADFAQGGGLESVLAARAGGLDVVALAALFQKTDVVYVARAGSGIRSFGDFAGRRISTWYTGIHLILRAMLGRAGVAPSAIVEVTQGGSMQPFIDGEVDVAAATFYNQLPKLHEAGIDDLVLFDPADHDVVIPRDPIITSNRVVAEKADIARRFLKASLRGWCHAAEHQAEAVAATLRRDPALDPHHQAVMMAEIAKLLLWGPGGRHGIGFLSDDTIRFAAGFLAQYGQLPEDLPLAGVFANDIWIDAGARDADTKYADALTIPPHGSAS